MPEADPAHYVRGQYDGYRDIDGVAPDSTTETYAAMRLEIDNWRWSGVPFFIRTGKRLPVTQTELRLVFKRPPRLGFQPRHAPPPEPNQLVVKLDPTTGVRLLARGAARRRARSRSRSSLDMEFAEEGGEGPTPYEVLLHAAMLGDSTRFTRQDGVEEAWRVMQPLLDAPPPVHPYAQGHLGPGGGGPAHGRPRPLARALDRAHERLRRHRDRQRGGRRHARAPSRARRASASCCSSAATGCRASRRTGRPRDVFVDNRYVSRGHVVRRRGQAVPAAGALLRRRRDEALRRRAVPPARGGLRRAAPPRRASRPPGRSPTTRWSRTTRSAEQLYQVHGARGEDPTEPPASAPYPFPAGRATSRASSSSPTTSRPPGCTRSTRRAACCSTSATCRTAAACGARRATASRAWCTRKSDAEVLGVRPALEHAERDADDRTREAVRLETDAAGRAVTGVVVERDGARETFTADLVVVVLRRREQRPAAAARRRTTSIRTGSPTAPTRSGATTCSTTARPCSRCRASRTRRCSRRRSGSTTSTSAAPDFEFPLGNIQMVGKSAAEMYRGEKPLADAAGARVDARGGRAPRGRLLALDRGPAATREPRDAAPPTAASRSRYTADQRGAEAAAAARAQVAARAPRHAPAPPDPPPRVPQERDPGRRLRPSGGHVPLRRPIRRARCSTATAAPTSSTTSTSSTRASSRASGR